MPLYLALSCLQGRPGVEALDDLLSLEPDGIQLTPGNILPPDFRTQVKSRDVPYMLHHGFDWVRRKRLVWDVNATCHALPGASVHPPMGAAEWSPLKRSHLSAPDRVYETMYPGARYVWLTRGQHIEHAMAMALPLAVDVSHLYIQRMHERLSDATWRRLQDYERVEEIHVSANGGQHDTHRRISATTFGLDWARERMADLPVVLECYMHRLTHSERAQQVALLRGNT